MHVPRVSCVRGLVRSVIIGVALATSVCAAPALGQNLPPWSTKVQVTVAGEDDIRNRVTSWLSEELRRMPDVAVVDSGPEWEIHVIAMQTKNQGGVVTGYALSEVVLQRLDFRPVAAVDTVRTHRDLWSFVLSVTPVSWTESDHNLYVGPTNDLRTTIEGLAAAFDTKELEPSRKAWEKLGHP